MVDAFTASAFDVLPADTILHVLSFMTPVQVLALCDSTEGFRRFCQDETLFKELMKVHYPSFPIFGTSRSQYEAITRGDTTSYSATLTDDYDVLNEELELPMVATDFNQGEGGDLVIQLLGNPVTRDTNMFLLSKRKTDEYLTVTENDLFAIREEAIEAFMTTGYNELLEELRIYADLEYGAVNNRTINAAAAATESPTPFSRNIVRTHLAEHGFVFNNSIQIVWRVQAITLLA
ncbi:MAG: hypothetical protein ACMG6E_04830 [Candidatus Roizmanbacteria bacterium]